jgi:D-alanyl-D-alanine carboxypeptidase
LVPLKNTPRLFSKKLFIVGLALGITFSVAFIILLSTLPTTDISQASADDWLSSISDKAAPEIEEPQESVDTLPESQTSYQEFYYYDPSRLNRYETFAAIHPDISLDDVVWMVDCDLDREPFEGATEITDPASIFALVNKHYCLPSWYVPSDLVTIGSTSMRAEAAEAMALLIAEAASDGMQIWASSGFRSYETQAGTYNSFAYQDGEWAADQYSARPGFSEHQTGLVCDICGYDGYFDVGYAENIWLADNAHRFGFIVRYTYENAEVTGYIAEEWHLRYIGREAATYMHENGVVSYEEYWVKHILFSS